MVKNKKITIDISRIPIDSSLGLLAYGDIAFTAWRKLKQENQRAKQKKKENEKK